jgi:glucose dehydrogenase
MVTPVLAQISSSRLADNATDDGNWLMYSGSYSSLRFSPLDRISTDNVGRLKPLWVYQPPGSGSLEATPVVADGVMYMTSGPASVVALDLRSGNPLWQWSRPIAPTVLNLGFPRVNRGVAIFDSLVYVGTLDGYLVALDAKTGVFSVGSSRSATTRVATPSLRRRSSLTARSSSASAAARPASAVTSTRTMRRRANASGACTPCRRLASPEATRGLAIAGCTAPARHG